MTMVWGFCRVSSSYNLLSWSFGLIFVGCFFFLWLFRWCGVVGAGGDGASNGDDASSDSEVVVVLSMVVRWRVFSYYYYCHCCRYLL